MEAKTLFNELCERHGVDPIQAERLLPLVSWALKGPQESRKRILAVVEKALSGDPGSDSCTKAELVAAADQAILMAVARVLHNWSPEGEILDLGSLDRPGEREESD